MDQMELKKEANIAELKKKFPFLSESLETLSEDKPQETISSGIVSEIIERANLPMRHLANKELHGDEWCNVFNSLKAKSFGGFLVLIVGKRGCGKTQMSVEMCKHYANNGKSCKYLSAMDLFIELKETYRGSGSERKVLNELVKPSLVVLDEVHERSDSEWENRMLTHLINLRYSAMKDTILIGNLEGTSVGASLGASIASRMVETGEVIKLNVDSYRKH